MPLSIPARECSRRNEVTLGSLNLDAHELVLADLESERAVVHILYTRACETAADNEKCREGIFPCQPPFRPIASGAGPPVCQMS